MSIFSKMRKKIEQKAAKLYDRSPFLFSHLPAFVKKAVFDEDVDAAEELKRIVERLQTGVDEKKVSVDGLRRQLLDLRTSDSDQQSFSRSNAREFKKYVR